MAQCQGTTKAGARCKRDANDETGYCGMHEDQADAPSAAGGADGGGGTDLLLVGAVAVGLFAIRRLLRFL